MTNDENGRELGARVNDLLTAARSYVPSATGFLTPADAELVKRLTAREREVRVRLYGGFGDAERKAALFLPEYMAVPDDESDFTDADSPENDLYNEFYDFINETIAAVKIAGSGYHELTHRDYLGSLTSLGMRRDVIGDILTTGECSAVIFVMRKIAPFIAENLVRIGGDAVSAEVFDSLGGVGAKRSGEYKAINDTVASPRLDAVVAALCGMAREKAAAAITGGRVSHNYREASKGSAEVRGGDVISVKGEGKFIVDGVSDVTKKGRLRLSARKYL